jgi:lipoprotein-anchoring transpeptidase ErfK/SrfK
MIRVRSATRRTPVLVASGVAVLSLALTACGSSDQSQAAAAAPASVDAQTAAALPEATTFGKIENLPKDTGTSPTEGQVLKAKKDVVVYDAAGGKPVAKLPATQLGSPTWVPEIAKKDGWSQVLLPNRPNKSTGWVHVTDSDFERAENDYLVTVDLASFHMEVTKKDQKVGEWTIGTGKPEFPTPTGRTYIMASIKETVTTYSPYILPLGAHSDSHETFGGGPGTVALHGWPDSSPFGKAGSDGCIRVPKDALDLLLTLPLGTVVIVK